MFQWNNLTESISSEVPTRVAQTNAPHPIHSLSWFAWWDWGWARSNLDDELAATAGRSGWWESGQSVNDWEFLFCFQRSKSNGTGSHIAVQSLCVQRERYLPYTFLWTLARGIQAWNHQPSYSSRLGSKVCWTAVPIRSSLGRALRKEISHGNCTIQCQKKKVFQQVRCPRFVRTYESKRWWWCRRPSCPLWLHAAAECQLASGSPCIEGSCAVRRATAVRTVYVSL